MRISPASVGFDYPEYEVLFAVSEGDDRVCAVIEKLRAISLLAPSA